MKKKLLIPVFLAALAMPLCLSQKAEGLDAYFIGIDTLADYLAHGKEVNGQLADEGFVLLKNQDNFLPMAGNERVSVVGKSSTNLVLGGSGSGAASTSSGVHEIQLNESLTSAGFEINPNMATFYSSASGGRTNGNTGYKGLSEVTIGETPFAEYTDKVKASMENDYNDAAIMVISREGSEGCDVKTCNAHDSRKTNESYEAISFKHALELSDNEQDLFDYITEKFENVIILVNSGNVFQCDQFENNDKVKAVLWIGCPGDVGTGAVGRILAGEVNPSGRTVDTWARDLTEDPTFQNFSDNAQTNLVERGGKKYYFPQDTLFNADGTPVKSEGTFRGDPTWDDEEAKVVTYGINGVRPASYVSYEEGIYYDYRYYETYYADMAKSNAASADDWYDGNEGVIYPFGYGLSYTSFEQKIVFSNISNKTLNSGNMKVKVDVEVKNTGNVDGKEVVQLYWKAPYKDGEIEKADRVLCAFDKTKMLEPGESQTLSLEFDTQDLANYDCFDANNNGFCGYELDGGDYQITLNKNAHEEIAAINFKVADAGIKYETDRYTGYKVENRFTDAGFYSSLPSEDDFEFTQMSRSDFEDTFPSHPTIEDRTLGANSRVQEFFEHAFTLEDIDSDVTDYEYMPREAYKTKEDIEALGWTQQETKLTNKEMKFEELYFTDIDDPKWDTFMNQLTYDEMIPFINGGDQNPGIDGTGKSGISSQDGPQKYKDGMSGKGIFWVCLPIAAATYNLELVHEQGRCIGNESHFTSSNYGWAGPAVNIHRSPFGGRNFEYYSADPLISGRMGGRVVAGATDGGLYCFFKHFAVNDQEKNREGVAAFLTEQALREIYLKAFQYVIQEGKSTGIMSSYNRLGLMETAASYPLLTEVLRNEWGFKGHVISDMTHRASGYGTTRTFINKYYENVNNRVLAGCNQQLDSNGYSDDIQAKWDNSKHCPVYNGVESYSWWYAIRTMCKGVLYSAARCGYTKQQRVNNADLEFEGARFGIYEAGVGDSVSVKVNAPERFAGDYELSIDPITPLPDGLSFDGQKISGSVAKAQTCFIHVLLSNDGKTYCSTLELHIVAVSDNSEISGNNQEPEKPAKKKGCFGAVEASIISVATLGILAITALLIDRKRKLAK